MAELDEEGFPTDIPCLEFVDGSFAVVEDPYGAAEDEETPATASATAELDEDGIPTNIPVLEFADGDFIAVDASSDTPLVTADAPLDELSEAGLQRAEELAERVTETREVKASETPPSEARGSADVSSFEVEAMIESAAASQRAEELAEQFTKAKQAEQLAAAKLRVATLAEAKLRAAQLADSMLQDDEPEVVDKPLSWQEHDKLLATRLGPTIGLDPSKRRYMTPEEERRYERAKRKNLWDQAPDCFIDLANRARPTLNGWENTRAEDLGNKQEKRKFLRLLGGKELADAEVEVISDGEEDTGGRSAEETEGLIDEADLPADCPVFEFGEGEFGESVFKAVGPSAGASPDDTPADGAEDPGQDLPFANEEIQRQYTQGLRQRNTRLGLGAA